MAALPGVAMTEPAGRLQDFGLYVIPADGGDLLPAVRDLCARQGLVLDELRLERGRLDGVFRDITTERLRRGVFTSVPELVAAINKYVAHHNKEPKPFICTKSARDILQKVIRANSRLSSKQNATLH